MGCNDPWENELVCAHALMPHTKGSRLCNGCLGLTKFPAGSDPGPGPVKGTNPKDLVGVKKVPNLSVIPAASIIYEGLAMRYGAYEAPKIDGSKGYGPFNWRDNKVVASIYVDAAIRHLMAWWDGEANAPDSKAPHLGHAKACLGILADAIESGNLVDDRPKPGPAAKLLEAWKR